MGRPNRIDTAGGWYHVVNRGVARQTVFHDDRDRVEFERLLGVGHERSGVEVHAFCLMTNHYHLVLHCPGGGLSDFMHDLGSVFVRHVNERIGRDGPLFRSRFASRPIDDPEYLLLAVRYVHRNPLALGPAVSLDRYRWSSHRSYVGRRAVPPWLRTETVLDAFGGDADRFHEFVTGDRRTSSIADPAGLAAAIDLVVDECGLDDGVARQGVARTVSALILDRLVGEHADALADALGFASPASREKAIRRARRQLTTRPALAQLLSRAYDLAA